jgi:uncharacterized SAM-binding protein YcdF (DUF218 family)
MFFFLSKVLFYFLMPMTWIVGSLMYALWTKNLRRRKRFLWIGLGLLFFFGNRFIANEAARLWEVPPTPYTQTSHYLVGIVLTGITEGHKPVKDRIFFNRSVGRIIAALDLYKSGKINRILITGATPELMGNNEPGEPSETHSLRDFLVKCGVPKDSILLETQARNTRENAKYSAEILEKSYPGKKLLLITSGFHIRRAKGCFEKSGLDIETFSADYSPHRRSWSLESLLIPSEEALLQWYGLLHEMLGFLVYKMLRYA